MILNSIDPIDPPIIALILAGGASSRMGQDKALIEIEGKPLLRRVCDVALQICHHPTDQVFVITPRVEPYRSILPDNVTYIREVFDLAEPRPHGPLLGFAQGLAHVAAPWVLLLACDLPCLDLQTLRAWREMLPTVPPDAIALLPKQTKGWEPLCGFYRRTCAASLSVFIQQGGRSFQHWLAAEVVTPIAIGVEVPEHMLLNCNRPEDIVKLQSILKDALPD